MTTDVRVELHRLLSGVCEGTATGSDALRLEALLRTDPACRRFYLRYVDLHAAILRHPDPAGLATTPPGVAAMRFRRWKLWPELAVLAVVVVGLAVWAAGPFRSDPVAPGLTTPVVGATSGYVATFAAGGDCRWESPASLRPGDRLPVGTYALAAGVAEVRLDGGAGLTVEAPARFRLDGRGEVTVEAGRVLFQADETAEPVRVHTPRSEYLNVDTRYVMAVTEVGDEVHVLDGEVRRTAPGRSESAAEVTPAGAARQYQGGGVAGRAIPLDRSVPRAAAEEPLGKGGLLAYDGFDYPGDKAAGPGRDGGFGWKSGWVPHSNLPPIWLDAVRKLPWPGGGDPGVAAHHRGGRTAMHRALETPIRMDRDDIYYLSFRCRRAAAEAADLSQLMVVLRKRGTTEEEERLWKSRLRFSVARQDAVVAAEIHGVTTRTPYPLVADTPYLFVGKVLAGRDRPDQAFLRVYRSEDPPTGGEPADWSVVSPLLYSDAAFDQVSVEFTGGAEFWLDDLRISRTWATATRP